MHKFAVFYRNVARQNQQPARAVAVEIAVAYYYMGGIVHPVKDHKPVKTRIRNFIF